MAVFTVARLRGVNPRSGFAAGIREAQLVLAKGPAPLSGPALLSEVLPRG